jgi:hypothetical protein
VPAKEFQEALPFETFLAIGGVQAASGEFPINPVLALFLSFQGS